MLARIHTITGDLRRLVANKTPRWASLRQLDVRDELVRHRTLRPKQPKTITRHHNPSVARIPLRKSPALSPRTPRQLTTESRGVRAMGEAELSRPRVATPVTIIGVVDRESRIGWCEHRPPTHQRPHRCNN